MAVSDPRRDAALSVHPKMAPGAAIRDTVFAVAVSAWVVSVVVASGLVTGSCLTVGPNYALPRDGHRRLCVQRCRRATVHP